jgi:hypothetical protein
MRKSKDARTAVGADQDHWARAPCPTYSIFGGRRYWDDAPRVKQPVSSWSYVFLKVSDRGAMSGSIRPTLPPAVATKTR